MYKTSILERAKTNKNDEFYTRYEDIERELSHYKDLLVDKIIYCNCDDYQTSNFVKYFIDNFERFHLKKLIATNYSGLPEHYQLSLLEEIVEPHTPYYFEYDGTNTHITRLNYNGSFCSEECLEILKGIDIVITNPPFSLMRLFIKTMFKYNKQFLIIGGLTFIAYKNIFNYFKNGTIRVGATFPKQFFNENGELCSIATMWYTTLPIKTNKPFIKLTETYEPSKYPKYDNYDIIEVPCYNKIPYNYNGYIGVPLTFIQYYNPNQFELVDILSCGGGQFVPCTKNYYDDEWVEYDENGNKTGRSSYRHHGYAYIGGKGDQCYLYNKDTNEYVHLLMVRLVIKIKEDY